ncbi:hypothetical protein ACFQET_07000 [Levilactobacillus tangyuanensis]|uniref:Uncharacterized protein n=1 Tax=Levilactobacillus tangyuanensis TaxID=2486021 RepID=A0ABW1TQC1_9LACO|nr:hypothetical protein [Levilactobacillus tangyuanensis]
MKFLLILILIALVYLYLVFGSANAKMVNRAKRGKTPDEKKVVEYFLRQGIARKLTGVMSDDDYVKMVENKANSLGLRQKAVEQTGLDESQIKEIKPINLVGYKFKNAWARNTDTNKNVSSRYEVTWIFFSETQLYMYTYTFDLDQDWHSSLTEEFFYQDVTSVSSSNTSETAKFMESGVEREKTVDTTEVHMVVPGDKMTFAMNGTDLSTANESVQGMKQMLREKKNA